MTLVLAALCAATLTLLGLGAVYVYAGDVPRGTSVLGIDIGGMSRAEATAALFEGLAQRSEMLAAPVAVRLGDAETEILPEAVGLAVDVEGTVAAAAVAGWRNPLAGRSGGRRVDPVVQVDADRLDAALRETAQAAGEAMTMPEIRFDGTTPVPVYPEPGLGLDPERSVAAMAQAWPPAEPADGWITPTVITVPLVELTPVTTAAEVDRLLAELARPAVAAPVDIAVAGQGSITVPPEVIARSLQLTADSQGEIIPEIDSEALREGLADQLAGIETAPVNAHFVRDGGQPRTVDAVPGELVDLEGIEADLIGALAEPAPRAVAASMTTGGVGVTAADLREQGVVEEVSSFTTHFDGGMSSPRTQNIVLIAELVDNTLVEPGEVFSLNGHTGERGYDEGFQDAAVILDGRLQPGVGGGISQFTTTLFNAAYYAGLEDVEHHPHSYWYSRYPAVIEATIFYPTLDLKFRNDTPYGVLIDTSYTAASVTVTLWSTRVFDEVSTHWGPKREIVAPRTRYVEPGPTCIDTEGIEGFTQSAWRIFHRDGIEVDREEFSWRYDAQPRVICDEEPDDE